LGSTEKPTFFVIASDPRFNRGERGNPADCGTPRNDKEKKSVSGLESPSYLAFVIASPSGRGNSAKCGIASSLRSSSRQSAGTF